MKKLIKKIFKILFWPVYKIYRNVNEKLDDLSNKQGILSLKLDDLSSKQDMLNLKLDDLIGKQDMLNQKQDGLSGKQDMLSIKLDNHHNVIKTNTFNSLNMLKSVSGNSIIDKQHSIFGKYISSNNTMLKSSVCRAQDLIDYKKWTDEMGKNLVHSHLTNSNCLLNRKAWEFVFIAQALYERGMIADGKKGLGFAVGKEPLPSLFAKYGCKIIATDIDSSTEAGMIWTTSNQHAGHLEDLYKTDICDKETFFKNVSYSFLDMNNITSDFADFDFCWSSCAFEHLGSIEKCKQFLYNMVNCLKPGGIAVHTTEYNLSYNGYMDAGWNANFGRADFREMYDSLTALGHHVEELDFQLGDLDNENYISYHPYDKPHFKLFIDGNICTSFALIIQKGVINEPKRV